MENQLVSYIVEIFGGAVLFLLTWLIIKIKTYIKTKTSIDLDIELQKYFIEAIEFSENKIKQAINSKLIEVRKDNDVINYSIKYLSEVAPNWLKKAGYTEKSIVNKLELYLNKKGA